MNQIAEHNTVLNCTKAKQVAFGEKFMSMGYQNFPFLPEMCGFSGTRRKTNKQNPTQLFHFTDSERFPSVVVVTVWQQLLLCDHLVLCSLLASVSVGLTSLLLLTSSACSSLTSSIGLLTHYLSINFS